MHSRRSSYPANFFRRSLSFPREFLPGVRFPRDPAEGEHAFACRTLIASHQTPPATARVSCKLLSRYHGFRGEISRWTKTVHALPTARGRTADGECSRTDADVRSGYQTPSSLPSGLGWSRPGKASTDPSAPVPSARTARLSRQQRISDSVRTRSAGNPKDGQVINGCERARAHSQAEICGWLGDALSTVCAPPGDAEVWPPG